MIDTALEQAPTGKLASILCAALPALLAIANKRLAFGKAHLRLARRPATFRMLALRESNLPRSQPSLVLGASFRTPTC